MYECVCNNCAVYTVYTLQRTASDCASVNEMLNNCAVMLYLLQHKYFPSDKCIVVRTGSVIVAVSEAT